MFEHQHVSPAHAALPSEDSRRFQVCGKCRADKPLSAFGRGERNKKLLKKICKACVVARQAAWGERNKDRVRVLPSEITCRMCGERKVATAFGRRAKTKAGIDTACFECLRAKDRMRYVQNPQHSGDQAKWGAIKHKFGLSREQWIAMYAKQHGCCAICKDRFETPLPRRDKRGACVDHCHQTGKVRGLLCSKCNQGVGLLRDDVGIVESALSYLRWCVDG